MVPRMKLAFLLAVLVACSSSPKPASHRPSDTGPLSEAEFKAMHALPTAGPAVREGQVIDLAGTRAYLALPKGPGPHPAILVIHEWWGLNANIEHWADRFARAGWAALAVDLYGGVVATERDQALAAMKAVDEGQAAATIAAGLDLLASDERIRAPRRAVVGWCFGGGWSLQTALAHPELDGAIIYYGQLVTDAAKLGAIKSRVLGVFGTRDKGIPLDEVAKFEGALRDAGVRAEILRYDADHAFANPSNPVYDEKHAGEAWKRVLAFLDAVKQG
ncbi:MAG: dienelactone hydrolase family protein [Deltaproteobacteria bacterium]|nr:dienelactone hydrolase family protein [Deltaproteobacteria bacterium]